MGGGRQFAQVEVDWATTCCCPLLFVFQTAQSCVVNNRTILRNESKDFETTWTRGDCFFRVVIHVEDFLHTGLLECNFLGSIYQVVDRVNNETVAVVIGC